MYRSWCQKKLQLDIPFDTLQDAPNCFFKRSLARQEKDLTANQLTLYVDSRFASTYAMSAFVTLQEDELSVHKTSLLSQLTTVDIVMLSRDTSPS